MTDDATTAAEPHLPPNAGAHAEGLKRVLARFDDGWVDIVSTGPGWYGIIIDLADKIAAIAPSYRIQQVKEKYGGLRFYYTLCLPDDPPHIAETMPAYCGPPPSPESGAAELQAYSAAEDAYTTALYAWGDVADAWFATPDGIAWIDERRELTDRVDQLVRDAELAAQSTCEICGAQGAHTHTSHRWTSTRCSSCATQH